MDSPAQLGPVPPAGIQDAVRCLAGGRRGDVASALRAEAYERMVTRCEGRHQFWWALDGRRCVAAALVLPNPGRVGMLFHSEPASPGVRAEWVPSVVRRASDEALADGLSFVQALVPPRRQDDLDVLVAAGYRRLAELVYMRLDLGAGDLRDDGPACIWRHYGQFGPQELADVILGTYEDSLDCPELCGLRAMEDVIAGHKASGRFRPESWWIAELAGRPAGCVLVSDASACADESDLVYMGVRKEFRGRGLGRAMVRRAARGAQQEGRLALTVAVDAANAHARRVYEAEGFRETTRRAAMFRPRPRPIAPRSSGDCE